MGEHGGGRMHLQELELTNFKGIESLTLPFKGKSTVLYGINGVGKSSVLYAINILFSRLINRISKYRPTLALAETDVSYGAHFTKIKGIFLFDDSQAVLYHRAYDKKQNQKTHNAKSLEAFTRHFLSLYLDEGAPSPNMPIFASYGVNRAVLDVPLRIRTTHTFERVAAFENAIQSKVDFRLFFEWFREREWLETKEKLESKNLDYKDGILEAVRTASTAMLSGFKNLQIRHSPLRMVIEKDGVTVRIDQLSDGEKCTIALFGDLARRLSIANPKLENPLLGGGIVLIDEVELHMHPAWQRIVIERLSKTFPNIQFIITTHSPQVLGGIPSNFNIFHLARVEIEDAGDEIQCLPVSPGYYDTNLVLEDYMHTPSVDPIITALEKDMFYLIREKRYDDARAIMARLRCLTNGTCPSVTKAEILIRRGEGT